LQTREETKKQNSRGKEGGIKKKQLRKKGTHLAGRAVDAGR
jgi:hypothetical protein